MELTGQKWANIKQGSSIFGKTLISLRRLPFGVNVMLNLSNLSIYVRYAHVHARSDRKGFRKSWTG